MAGHSSHLELLRLWKHKNHPPSVRQSVETRHHPLQQVHNFAKTVFFWQLYYQCWLSVQHGYHQHQRDRLLHWGDHLVEPRDVQVLLQYFCRIFPLRHPGLPTEVGILDIRRLCGKTELVWDWGGELCNVSWTSTIPTRPGRATWPTTRRTGSSAWSLSVPTTTSRGTAAVRSPTLTSPTSSGETLHNLSSCSDHCCFIRLRRRPMFYVFNLILPCVLINGIGNDYQPSVEPLSALVLQLCWCSTSPQSPERKWPSVSPPFSPWQSFWWPLERVFHQLRKLLS